MARKKKHQIPFDSDGGTIVSARRLYASNNYLTLSPYAKALMPLLHSHWRHYKLVDYGVREAAEKIPCDRRTAIKAFKQLEHRGFISCIEQSVFSSRTQCKARGWRLEWLPFNDNFPINTWEKWTDEN
jgi:hypothetical protein